MLKRLKTAENARQWAESETEPDEIEGAKSAKSWSELSKDHANAAAASALASKNSADTAAVSAKAGSDSAKAATLSSQNAASSETVAKQSAELAAAKLEKLETVDLPLKADVSSPWAA